MKKHVKLIIGIVSLLLVTVVVVVALLPENNFVKEILHSEGNTWQPSTTTSRTPNGTTAAPTSTTSSTDEEATTSVTEAEKTDATEQTDKTEETKKTKKTTTKQTKKTTTSTTSNVPSGGSVIIPTTVDPETGKEMVVFPCTIQPYNLVIEKMAPYSGKYVEDGTNNAVTDVAMLLVHNQSDQPIEYASLTVEFEGTTLLFDISALPAGSKAVVQEKMRRNIPDGDAVAAKALVVQRAEQGFSEDQVKVTENEDGSLLVTNLTSETIPAVRLFYKYYLEDEKVYVGGIAFSAKVSQLRPGASLTIRPTHYEAGSSRIVMVSAYEEDA